MLDLMRLEKCPLLQAAGWNRSRAGCLAERLGRLNLCYPPPVPPEAIFPAAWEIVDALEGTVIPNQCPELGLGATCHAVEFDFLGYDASLRPELEAIGKVLGRQQHLFPENPAPKQCKATEHYRYVRSPVNRLKTKASRPEKRTVAVPSSKKLCSPAGFLAEMFWESFTDWLQAVIRRMSWQKRGANTQTARYPPAAMPC